VESKSEILCLQETKKDNFDISFIRNFCPPDFDSFEFLPSVGALGGLLVIWKGNAFWENLVFINRFALSVEFTSKLSNDTWLLTRIYAPCTTIGKKGIFGVVREIDMPPEIDWLIVGDFNLIRRPDDRNRDGADPNEMFLLNEAINNLGLIELPLHGRQFTWTNKQFPPLRKIGLVLHLNLLDFQVPKYFSQNFGHGNI